MLSLDSCLRVYVGAEGRMSSSWLHGFNVANTKVLSPDTFNQQQGNQTVDRCPDTAEQRHPSVQPNQRAISLQLDEIWDWWEQLGTSAVIPPPPASHIHALAHREVCIVVSMKRCNTVRSLTQRSFGCLRWQITLSPLNLSVRFCLNLSPSQASTSKSVCANISARFLANLRAVCGDVHVFMLRVCAWERRCRSVWQV